MTYVRFVALGDSTTAGIGDPVPGGWRGWARLLADAIGTGHDVSFCNLAVPGAVAGDVRREQLPAALAHRPDLASLVVGVNDTLRSTYDPARIREDVLATAQALHAVGAVLLTLRFHDHGAVFGLPGVLRRPLLRRIDLVNAVYDEVRATYGGLQVDLALHPETMDRAFWSVDRLHPSERGHRALAREFARQLDGLGLSFEPPAAEPDGGHVPTWRTDLHWLVTAGVPWVGRRTRDLAPWATRVALAEARSRVAVRPADRTVGLLR